MKDDKQSMNIKKASSEQSDQKLTTGSWPLKLNKALIAMGVIAFGLIVTDRLLEAFRADDAPAVASIDGAAVDGTEESMAKVLTEADKVQLDERNSLVELQNLIGSRVVFVSATEPGYVVTEDERRIYVGDAIADATTLAGVTTHQIILEKSGEDLKIFNLPDPVVQ